MKAKKITLVLAASAMASVLAVGLGTTKVLSVNASCEHSGNHYSALAATHTNPGAKENWVCCKCHEVFLSQPASGTWTDNGVAAAVAESDSRYVARSSVFTASDFGAIAGTVTDTEGGIESTGLNAYGARVYTNDKVHIDGLKFSFSVSGMVDSVGDCRGFYFHAGTTGANSYYSEEASLVISQWSVFGQTRIVARSDHNYKETASLARAYMNDTVNGMSEAAGHLVANFESTYTVSYEFEKVNDSWYKMTVRYGQIWGSPNYNANGGSDAFTYFHAEDVHADANGNAHLSIFSMPNHGSDTTIKLTNFSQK